MNSNASVLAQFCIYENISNRLELRDIQSLATTCCALSECARHDRYLRALLVLRRAMRLYKEQRNSYTAFIRHVIESGHHYGHEVAQFLSENHPATDFTDYMNAAVSGGHLEFIQYLHDTH